MEASSASARADSLYVTLVHGNLAMRTPELRVEAGGALAAGGGSCHATAEGDGALRTGGVLRAADGPVRLRLACTCTKAAASEAGGGVLANLSLTLRLPEYTSPVVSFPHVCQLAPAA